LFLFANQTNLKQVKQDVICTVILPPLLFPGSTYRINVCQAASITADAVKNRGGNGGGGALTRSPWTVSYFGKKYLSFRPLLTSYKNGEDGLGDREVKQLRGKETYRQRHTSRDIQAERQRETKRNRENVKQVLLSKLLGMEDVFA
jgi:hypothetical protein